MPFFLILSTVDLLRELSVKLIAKKKVRSLAIWADPLELWSMMSIFFADLLPG